MAAALLVLGGAAAGCTADTEAGTGSAGSAPGSSASAPASASGSPSAQGVQPTATVTPEDGATGINPAQAPVITVQDGTVETARVVPAGAGTPINGTVSDDGRVWTADGALDFATTYTLEYTLANDSGTKTEETRTFSTLPAANEADAFMYPASGSDVGTGQPIEITFSEPVLNKEDVEKAITVTSTSGQEGAFYWISDTKVRYRAPEFWAPDSTVTVDVRLFGLDLGNSMVGNFNDTWTFTVHNTRLAVVDNADKMMRVYIDGQLTQTFPVTLGTQDWPSTEGYHVIMDQHETMPFNAESIGLQPGDPNYYEPVTVNHASRLSTGGAFIHEALPAAQPILGMMNVSHGCVGMSPEGAKYMYENFGPGDVVQILNTGYGPMYVWDGFGDWNLSWEDWVNGVQQ